MSGRMRILNAFAGLLALPFWQQCVLGGLTGALAAGLVVAVFITTGGAGEPELIQSETAIAATPVDPPPGITIPPATTTTTAAVVESTVVGYAKPPAASVPVVAPVTRGIHVLGDTIQPGLYRVTGRATAYAQDGGIVRVAESGHGTSLALIREPAATVAVIGRLDPITGPIDPIARNLTDGGYLVNFDLPAGTYRLTGEYSRMARLDENLTVIDEVVGAGSTITVDVTDYAIHFGGGPIVFDQQ